MGVVDGAGVGVDPAGQIHCHPRNPGRGQAVDDPVGRLAQRSASAQAHHAVDGDIRDRKTRAHRLRVVDPPADTAQGDQAASVCAVRVEHHGVDATATGPEHRAGVERVAPVVAGTDQQLHRPAIEAPGALPQ